MLPSRSAILLFLLWPWVCWFPSEITTVLNDFLQVALPDVQQGLHLHLDPFPVVVVHQSPGRRVKLGLHKGHSIICNNFTSYWRRHNQSKRLHYLPLGLLHFPLLLYLQHTQNNLSNSLYQRSQLYVLYVAMLVALLSAHFSTFHVPQEALQLRNGARGIAQEWQIHYSWTIKWKMRFSHRLPSRHTMSFCPAMVLLNPNTQLFIGR